LKPLAMAARGFDDAVIRARVDQGARHDRIVEAAARAHPAERHNGTGRRRYHEGGRLDARGFYDTPVPEAMLAEAADRAGSESVAMMERIAATTHRSWHSNDDAGLSLEAHVEGLRRAGNAPLGSEMHVRRQGPPRRHARIKR